MFTRPASHVPLCWMLGATASCSDSRHQSVSADWCLSFFFKEAFVKPLLKKPSLDPNNLKNCQSFFYFFNPKSQKIVLFQLSAQLNASNLFPTSQSAYRPGNSTETALLKMMNDILHALDNGDVTVVILLDLSAAFDTIDHNILSKTWAPLRNFWYTSGSDPTFAIELRLLPSTTNFHIQPCSTLAFSKALSWDLFYSFCTQNLLLHSFDDTPFLTSLSQMTPSCTIPAVQIK